MNNLVNRFSPDLRVAAVAMVENASLIAHKAWQEASDAWYWGCSTSDIEGESHASGKACDVLWQARYERFKAFDAEPIESLQDCRNNLAVALVREREMAYPNEPENTWQAVDKVIAFLDQLLDRKSELR